MGPLRTLAALVGVLALLLGCTDEDVADDGRDAPDDEFVEEAEESDAEVPTDADADPDADHGDEGSAEPVALDELDERATEGRQLIRGGSVTIEVDTGFDEAYRELSALGERLGGGVADVRSETDDAGRTRGTVALEVPTEAFDELLVEVADLGVVLRRDVATEDVTSEHVDLRSRLRHLERQEAFYLDLFDEAEGVDDAVTLQDRLESVQQRIEELQGRLDQLDRQVATSTLEVEVVPEGADPDHGEPVIGFAGYWDDARAAFVSVTGTLLVVVVGGAPLALAAAALLAIAVVLVRAWRHAGAH